MIVLVKIVETTYVYVEADATDEAIEIALERYDNNYDHKTNIETTINPNLMGIDPFIERRQHAELV